LIEAVELFNAGEFFACHDLLEELWAERLEDDRTLYQGLIHAAVALFHFEGGNLGGARKMYGSAVRYLRPYLPDGAGLRLDEFLPALERCFADLLALRDPTGAAVRLDADFIPRWTWVDRPSP